MSAELFNESERELIDAARLVLSAGIERLKSREALFPSNRTKGRAARAEVLAAREALVDYLVATYGALRHEVAACCLIDAQGRLISIEEFPAGKATHVEICRRRLAGWIVSSGAAAIVLVHNHPSGDNTPSKADIALTHELGHWLAAMECSLVDHLVLSTAGASAIIGEL